MSALKPSSFKIIRFPIGESNRYVGVAWDYDHAFLVSSRDKDSYTEARKEIEAMAEARGFSLRWYDGQYVFDKMMDAAGVDYEIHRFGHWGPGWFEIMLVEPNEAGEKLVNDTIGALANYPVLDDELFSELENEAREADWNDYGRQEFLAGLREHCDVSEVLTDWLDHDKREDLLYELAQTHESGYCTEHGFSWNWPRSDKELVVVRAQLRTAIVAYRKKN